MSGSETASDRSATAYIDGGARGNPGPAGYGVHIEQADGSIVELKESLGTATNNVAEYRGLLAALRWAAEHGITTLRVRSDSELLVRQLRGEYRVKSPGLLPLYEEARSLIARIGRVTFEHIPRESNRDADRLANEAMDEGGGVKKSGHGLWSTVYGDDPKPETRNQSPETRDQSQRLTPPRE